MTWKLFAVTTPLSYTNSVEVEDKDAELVCEVFGKAGYSLLRDVSQRSVYVAPPGYVIQVPPPSEPIRVGHPKKTSRRLLPGLHPRPVQRAPVHSDDEVEAAVEALSTTDRIRLTFAATSHNWILKPAGRSPQELVDEALVRTLEGRRRWSHRHNFFEHLWSTMNSIANSWKKQLPSLPNQSLEALVSFDVVDPVDPFQDLEAEEEFEVALKRRLQERGADVALKILERFRLGDEPHEVINHLGIDRKTYDAQVLKLRRYGKALRLKGNG